MGAIFSCGKCQQKGISYCECSPKEENYPHESIMQAEIDQLRAALDRYKKVVDEACGLLKIASCPNRNCTGGVLQVGINGDDIEQCQWCYFRDELLRELEANNVSRQP